MKSKLLIAFLLIIATASYAQEINITGKVTDVENGAQPGVNIIEKGTFNGTVTDMAGN
jgi:hypothetical protein